MNKKQKMQQMNKMKTMQLSKKNRIQKIVGLSIGATAATVMLSMPASAEETTTEPSTNQTDNQTETADKSAATNKVEEVEKTNAAEEAAAQVAAATKAAEEAAQAEAAKQAEEVAQAEAAKQAEEAAQAEAAKQAEEAAQVEVSEVLEETTQEEVTQEEASKVEEAEVQEEVTQEVSTQSEETMPLESEKQDVENESAAIAEMKQPEKVVEELSSTPIIPLPTNNKTEVLALVQPVATVSNTSKANRLMGTLSPTVQYVPVNTMYGSYTITAFLNKEGTIVSGKTDANSVIEVILTNFRGDFIASTMAEPDGTYTINIPITLTDRGDLLICAYDIFGNESETLVPLEKMDIIAPNLTATLNPEGDIVSGQTVAGAVIIVNDEKGNFLGRGEAKSNGSYTVNLNRPLTDKAKGIVVATDMAGNVSEPFTVIGKKDTMAPDAPTDLKVSVDGLKLTGKAEPDATIRVTDDLGNQIGEGKVDDLGNFTATLNTPQKNGESLKVIVTDPMLNSSMPGTVKAGDTTAPKVLTASIDEAGYIIKGNTEAGAKVIVTDTKGKVIGEDTAGDKGSFTIHLIMVGLMIRKMMVIQMTVKQMTVKQMTAKQTTLEVMTQLKHQKKRRQLYRLKLQHRILQRHQIMC